MYRKLFRYSLRSFLVFVFLTGTVGAWFANHSYVQRSEAALVEQLIALDKGLELNRHESTDDEYLKRITCYAGLG